MNLEKIDTVANEAIEEATRVFNGYHAKYLPVIDGFNLMFHLEGPIMGTSVFLLHYHLHGEDGCNTQAMLFVTQDMEDDSAASEITTALCDAVSSPVRSAVIQYLFPEESAEPTVN